MNNAGPSAGLGNSSSPAAAAASSAARRSNPTSTSRPNMPTAVTQDDETTAGAGTSSSSSSPLHSGTRARDRVTTKKSEWLDHMLRNLDIVTYCHFSYLYFLDISFIRFLIRAIVQINLFAQKPPNFPAQRSQKRSAVVSIFGSTLICFLFHLFSDPPSASELTGGYLHGGMVIDFVGQEGPISRLRLVLLDITILLLQLTMLTAKVYKQDMLDTTGPNRIIPAQYIDSEERGVDASTAPHQNDDDSDDDLPFSPSDDSNAASSSRREREPLRSSQRRRRRSEEVNLYSGDAIAADLRIVQTVRSQWRAGNSTSAGQSASAAMASNLATARLRMLLRRR